MDIVKLRLVFEDSTIGWSEKMTRYLAEIILAHQIAYGVPWEGKRVISARIFPFFS